jgi:hypothetical protein
MKAMGLMLRIEGDDSDAENRRLFYLGKAHRFKSNVRPWHFRYNKGKCKRQISAT